MQHLCCCVTGAGPLKLASPAWVVGWLGQLGWHAPRERFCNACRCHNELQECGSRGGLDVCHSCCKFNSICIHLYALTHSSSPQKAELGARDTLKAAIVATDAALYRASISM